MQRKVIGSILFFLLYFLSPLFALPADVEPLNNQDYFPKVLRAISEAQKEIKIVMFSAIRYTSTHYRNSPSNRIFESLASAAKRGVLVEVIFEDGGGTISKNDSFSLDNRPVAQWLAKKGVHVYFDTPGRTTHAKLMIIDRQTILLGSANWTYSGLMRNNEAGAILKSEELADEYIRYFEEVRKVSTKYIDK